MKLHANAALSWTGRRRLCELVVDEGWTLVAAAAATGVSVRCARKWVGRYRLEGIAGLRDRSSAPRHVANRTAPDRVAAIVKLRRLRFTAAEIAETLGMALSTVSGILTRIGMGKLGRLGLEPAVRYERSRPGELVHVDVKKLGRIQGGAGWRARGGAHVAAVHAIACRRLRIKHLRTRPYRPQTNGKAERFIRTMLAGWAYGAIYGSSNERTAALDGWLWHYNHRRKHSALSHQPPISRTNLLGSYT